MQKARPSTSTAFLCLLTLALVCGLAFSATYVLRNRTPILSRMAEHSATYWRTNDLVRELKTAGAHVFAVDDEGRTLLLRLDRNRPDIGEISSEHIRKWTNLHVISVMRKSHEVDLLLERPALSLGHAQS